MFSFFAIFGKRNWFPVQDCVKLRTEVVRVSRGTRWRFDAGLQSDLLTATQPGTTGDDMDFFRCRQIRMNVRFLLRMRIQ